MGNWSILIHGHGCHHNKRPDIDADIATQDLVVRLKAQTSEVSHAVFTVDGNPPQNLLATPAPTTPITEKLYQLKLEWEDRPASRRQTQVQILLSQAKQLMEDELAGKPDVVPGE